MVSGHFSFYNWSFTALFVVSSAVIAICVRIFIFMCSYNIIAITNARNQACVLRNTRTIIPYTIYVYICMCNHRCCNCSNAPFKLKTNDAQCVAKVRVNCQENELCAIHTYICWSIYISVYMFVCVHNSVSASISLQTTK